MVSAQMGSQSIDCEEPTRSRQVRIGIQHGAEMNDNPLVLAYDTANEVYEAAAAVFDDTRLTTQASRAGRTRELLHALIFIRDPRQRWMASRRPALNPAF